MPNWTPWEQEWVRIQEELREHPGVQVFRDTRGPMNPDAVPSASGSSERHPPLDSSLYERSVRFSEIGSQWKTVDPYPLVTGEFFLTPLPKAVREIPPSFPPSLYPEEEQRIGAELHIIDDAPYTGAGSFVGIRIQPEVTDPEIWFSDHTRGLWQMDLDYHTYVEYLRRTKGAFGWQHLYTRAPLNDWEFERTADRIARMLDVLPQVFPDYDYTPLRQQLEVRL
ncbi:hypothetical protein [Streptomyces platensis]|uniref:hypothetical protein n=1 Tax=Streptomyces platensis TaxID=58346 RepID=UPI002E82003A|nr:hypothetical protein [Streptomyces platensis]WUB80288.1 hypothetical protein OG424_14490 [Streptomyces platensis]